MTDVSCATCAHWAGRGNNLEAPCRAHESVGMTFGQLFRRGGTGAVARPENAGEIAPGVRYVLLTSRGFACRDYKAGAGGAEP